VNIISPEIRDVVGADGIEAPASNRGLLKLKRLSKQASPTGVADVGELVESSLGTWEVHTSLQDAVLKTQVPKHEVEEDRGMDGGVSRSS
jgi:hypothetical protein